jgi:hypothetical protein
MSDKSLIILACLALTLMLAGCLMGWLVAHHLSRMADLLDAWTRISDDPPVPEAPSAEGFEDSRDRAEVLQTPPWRDLDSDPTTPGGLEQRLYGDIRGRRLPPQEHTGVTFPPEPPWDLPPPLPRDDAP